MSGKILLLSRYGRLGASSRLRTIQYLPGLMLEGFQVEVAPLFADRYIERLYTGAVPFLEVLRSYSRRFSRLFKKRTSMSSGWKRRYGRGCPGCWIG